MRAINSALAVSTLLTGAALAETISFDEMKKFMKLEAPDKAAENEAAAKSRGDEDVHSYLMRAGLVPEEVCVECSDKRNILEASHETLIRGNGASQHDRAGPEGNGDRPGDYPRGLKASQNGQLAPG